MPDAFLFVRVIPRSSRDEITGWQDGVLRVRLKAPPVDGRANVALCQFIASKLDLAVKDVEVVSGASARAKRLRITSLSVEEVRARLG